MNNWQENKEARRAAYSEKLKDPRWQKMRLQVLERDGWKCRNCDSSENTLHVHHLYYLPDCEPWEYPDLAFVAFCEECHRNETEQRPEAEKSVLHCLRKKGFSASLLDLLVEALDELSDGYEDKCIPEMIWMTLSDKETAGIVWQKYLDSLPNEFGAKGLSKEMIK